MNEGIEAGEVEKKMLHSFQTSESHEHMYSMYVIMCFGKVLLLEER